MSITSVSPPSRRHFTKARRALSPQQRQQAGKQAARWLTKLTSRLPKRARVGIYYDDFGELPTQSILSWCNQLGYPVFLPVVGSLGRITRRQGRNPYKRLRFAAINRGKLINLPTYQHALGMPQNHQRQLLWVSQLDVLFCPLVAIDRRGVRMGMGGGFYDTTLSDYQRFNLPKPLLIGWCYDFQLVDTLPKQPWDVPMAAVITPSGIRWF